jgi:hypothetical protein
VFCGDNIGLGAQSVTLNGTSGMTASILVNATTTGSINAPGSSGTAGSMVFSRSAAQVLAIVYAGCSQGDGWIPPQLSISSPFLHQ